MKILAALLFLFLFSAPLMAQFNKSKKENTTQSNTQTQSNTSSTAAADEDPKGFSLSKLIYGGNLGLSFGNPTYISASPILGYRFTPKFGAGVNTSYSYYRARLLDQPTQITYTAKRNSLSLGLFGRYQIFNSFYASLEPELFKSWAKISAPNNNFTESTQWYQSVLVGGGYIQRFGNRAGINIQILYDVLQQNPLYKGIPVIRGGVTLGF